VKDSTKQWLEYAARDLKAAELVMKESYLSNVCLYHCQQAIEKAFKAILEEATIKIPRIHSVTALYEKFPTEIKAKVIIDTNVLGEIDDIYTDSRYPADVGLLPDGFPSEEKAKEIYDISKKMFDEINKYLENT